RHAESQERHRQRGGSEGGSEAGCVHVISGVVGSRQPTLIRSSVTHLLQPEENGMSGPLALARWRAVGANRWLLVVVRTDPEHQRQLVIPAMGGPEQPHPELLADAH